MAQKTRVELQAQIDALLADNNVGAITPLNVRTVEGDNIDSNFNKSTDTLDDIASGVTNVQYPATDKAKVDNVPADTITELLDKFSKSIDDSDDITEGIVNLFLTVLERAKLVNVPNDTNADLDLKFNKTGGDVNGDINLNNNRVLYGRDSLGNLQLLAAITSGDIILLADSDLPATLRAASLTIAAITTINAALTSTGRITADGGFKMLNNQTLIGVDNLGNDQVLVGITSSNNVNFGDADLASIMRGSLFTVTPASIFNGLITANAGLNPNEINSVAIANYVIIGGDIGGTGATPVINNDAITNAKLANIATNRIKGRSSSGTGDVEDLTAAEVKTMLNLPTNTVSDLGDKVNKSGDTLTGALLGDQSIRGHRPPTTVIRASVTLSTTQQNQFQYIDPTAGNIVLTLDTATTNLAAIGVEFDFMVQNTTNSVTISVRERVVSYVQGIGRVTGEAEITVTGATVFQIKKTANREFAIIGGGMSL